MFYRKTIKKLQNKIDDLETDLNLLNVYYSQNSKAVNTLQTDADELKKSMSEQIELYSKISNIASTYSKFIILIKLNNDDLKLIYVENYNVSYSKFSNKELKMTNLSVSPRKDKLIAVEFKDETIRTCKFLRIIKDEKRECYMNLVSFQNNIFENARKYNWEVNSTTEEDVPVLVLEEKSIYTCKNIDCILNVLNYETIIY